jgi:dTDP-4-dehydrorhamnose 3,5-epimerase
MTMKCEPTSIPDVILIKPTVHGDARGFFLETWHERQFAAAGLDISFVQDNHSFSARHTLRGLHYQVQQTQGKLVRVATGTVFDVAVDLRRDSPTLGRWVGVELSGDNHQMLWVPPGFAHGFLVLSETAHFLYRCTDFWSPAHERAIIWSDPDLRIEWPLPEGTRPALSSKDAAGIRFSEAELLP